MVRYLKYIVLVFGSLGLMIGSFFFFQNKEDILQAWSASEKIDYAYLAQNCDAEKSAMSCLEREFAEYAKKVSITGMGIGMKMVFNVIDHEKFSVRPLESEIESKIYYSLVYLRINNSAMANVYKNYNGFQVFYAGFIGSLPKFYEDAFEFSENLLNGLHGPDGIEQLADGEKKQQYLSELKEVEDNYFRLKSTALEFIENETNRLKKLAGEE